MVLRGRVALLRPSAHLFLSLLFYRQDAGTLGVNFSSKKDISYSPFFMGYEEPFITILPKLAE